MLDPAGTATPEAPLVVTDRLTGCDVLGAVASQAVNVSATGASHRAPRTRDRSIIRTSPKGDVSTIVPSSGSKAPAAACEAHHLFVGRWRSGSRVVTPYDARTSVSDLVNGAVRQSLGEDAADLAAFDASARGGLGVPRGAERPEAAWQGIST